MAEYFSVNDFSKYIIRARDGYYILDPESLHIFTSYDEENSVRFIQVSYKTAEELSKISDSKKENMLDTGLFYERTVFEKDYIIVYKGCAYYVDSFIGWRGDCHIAGDKNNWITWTNWRCWLNWVGLWK